MSDDRETPETPETPADKPKARKAPAKPAVKKAKAQPEVDATVPADNTSAETAAKVESESPEAPVRKATAAQAKTADVAIDAAEKPVVKDGEANPKPAARPVPAAGAVAKKAPPPPDPRAEAAKAKAEVIKQVIEGAMSTGVVEEVGAAHFNPMLVIRKQDWAKVVDLLRTHNDYLLNYAELMAGTDYMEKGYLEVTLYLQSTSLGHFVCLKTRTDREAAEVPSIVSLHPGVNWEEREIYDLVGVNFTGHPDLRRIMLDDDFKGHPLRKDYSVWDEA